MNAFADALAPLVDELAAFVRDSSCRLLHVGVGAALRPAAVEIVGAHEYRAENPSPFFVFEHDHTAATPGWTARLGHARAVHAARHHHHADPTRIDLPLAALPPEPSKGDEATRFALQLTQLLAAAPPHTEGLVVVLAPRVLTARQQWRATLELLLRGRGLEEIRWVVIEPDPAELGPLAQRLGSAATHLDVRMHDDDALAELERLATGQPRPGPKGVTPPERADVSPEPDEAGERRLALAQHVLSAALATARGQHAEAIAAQRRARELCVASGWHDESVSMELTLGGYLIAAGAVREAECAFLRAIEAAREQHHAGKTAIAGFALGATRALRGEPHTALVAYAEAALAAEDGGNQWLAIEGYRLAGDAARDLRMDAQAIAFHGRAVRLGESADLEASRSSAAAAARSLAQLCRRRGLATQADELDAKAQAFGRPRDTGDDGVATSAGALSVDEPPAREATDVLTLAEIARLHWGGVIDDPTPPIEGSRSWTRDEIDVVQRAAWQSLDRETSAMLSRDELAVLRADPPEGCVVLRREDLDALRRTAAAAESAAPEEPADSEES